MSDLIGPNGQPVNKASFSLARTQIGGVECEYQTDPRVGINQIQAEAFGLAGILMGNPPRPVYVLVAPENLLGFLASQINMNSAVIRELMQLRAQVAALTEALEESRASAPTERIEAADERAGAEP